MEHGLPKVEMGIRVHSGDVVLGNIGSDLRAKYTAMGTTVNLTSRVESYTVGGQVLISEVTRQRCGDTVSLGQSQTLTPKGVKGTLVVHEVLGNFGPLLCSARARAGNAAQTAGSAFDPVLLSSSKNKLASCLRMELWKRYLMSEWSCGQAKRWPQTATCFCAWFARNRQMICWPGICTARCCASLRRVFITCG